MYILCLGKAKYNEEIQSIAVTMLYGNSFTNPIIYNACNEEFRKSFRSYFRMLIKPCARLVLRDRFDWDDGPQILDDLGTTFHRTRSVRRSSSRRETIASVNTRTNGELPLKLPKSNRKGTSKRVSYAECLVNEQYVCAKDTDRINHCCSGPYRKASFVQYVSVL